MKQNTILFIWLAAGIITVMACMCSCTSEKGYRYAVKQYANFR